MSFRRADSIRGTMTVATPSEPMRAVTKADAHTVKSIPIPKSINCVGMGKGGGEVYGSMIGSQ